MKKILLFTLFAVSTAHSQSKKIEMPIIVDLRIKDSSPHFILNRRTVTIDALGDWLSTASKRYGPHDPVVVRIFQDIQLSTLIDLNSLILKSHNRIFIFQYDGTESEPEHQIFITAPKDVDFAFPIFRHTFNPTKPGGTPIRP